MSTIEQQDQWRPRTAGEFQRFFQTDLAPCLQVCEQDRQRTARNVMLLLGIVAALAAIGALVVLANVPEPMALLFIAIPALATAGIGYHAITHGYRTRFKHNFVAQIVRFFGPGFEYDPIGHIGQHRFEQCRIFQHRIDRYRGEDYIAGQAGKTRFECSEIHAEYKTTHRGPKGQRRTQWHTIFRGDRKSVV